MSIFNPFQKLQQPETTLLYSDSRQGLIASQIVYVETKYHHKFNQFIRENYIAIERKFKKKGFDFIYFPIISEDFSKKDNLLQIESLLNYCYPFISNHFGYFSDSYITAHLPLSLKITTASKTLKLLSAMGYDKKIHPGWIRLVSEEDEARFIFEYQQLDLSNPQDYWEQIEGYLNTLEPVSVSEDRLEFLPLSMPDNIIINELLDGIVDEPSETANDISIADRQTLISFEEIPKQEMSKKKASAEQDSFLLKKSVKCKETSLRKNETFSLSKHHIVEKVLNIIREAKSLGIYEEVIHDIFSALKNPNEKEADVKISRIVIDSDYRIFLPDYGSLEISMTTLPKSLFILFLRHPEGIVLKQLFDYRHELEHIYKTISNRTDLILMSESIERLCNPADSSINEKLSRIREAFIRKMSDSNASNYYVTGSRGEKKHITLNRELVSMPEELTGVI
ncbi:MAG: hypothetical protein LBC68_10430 [Prevotellaceae bacterium]|jgi:hypothetical protein|nr:hypothetical protein [Prevotellaceae bacterium]